MDWPMVAMTAAWLGIERVVDSVISKAEPKASNADAK